MPLREDSRGLTSSAAVTLHRYDERAQIHRPNDSALLAREVSRLVATGLTPRDVAIALRLDLGEVLSILRPMLDFQEAKEAHARVWTR
jgi:hypothetical protein